MREEKPLRWWVVVSVLVFGLVFGLIGVVEAEESRPVGNPATSRPVGRFVKRSENPRSRRSGRMVVSPTSRPVVGVRVGSTSRPVGNPATSRPVRKKAIHPTSRLVGRVVHPTSRPVVRGRDRKGMPGGVFLKRGRPLLVPRRMALLSFALPVGYEIWLDGLRVGRAPVAYLRLGVGLHNASFVISGQGQESFRLKVREGLHQAVAVKFDRYRLKEKGTLGIRVLRHEEVDVLVRSYRGGRPHEERRASGDYCFGVGRCVFLVPGESLYIRGDGRFLRLPPKRALLNAQAYRGRSGDGLLTLTTFPPGVLFLGGRAYAPTPVANLPLRPGSYRAEVRNGYLGLSWSGRLEIRGGEIVRRVVYLHARGGGSLQIQSQRAARIFVNGEFRGWTPSHVLPLKVGEHGVELHFGNGERIRRKVKIVSGGRVQLRF